MASLPHPLNPPGSPAQVATLSDRERKVRTLTELTQLYHRGDPALRLLHQWVNDEFEGVKSTMVSCTPDAVAHHQGEARAFKKIIDVLTNARKITT